MNERITIVTGAYGALGSAVSAAFAARGDQVARVDFAGTPPDETAALDLPGKDIAVPEVAEKVMWRILESLGGSFVEFSLINIAGGFAYETLDDGSIHTWERMFRMNALTAASMSRAAIKSMRRAGGGAIVNVGAGAAISSGAGMGAYAASKAAVHRLTESLAAELRADRITVNAILPSIIDTPGNRAQMPDADRSEWVQPAAIADVLMFLTSPAARAITGALIPVTRGTPN